MATAQQNASFTRDLLPRYPLDEAIDWIKENLEPDEVFDTSTLEAWAEENGYIKQPE